MAGPRWIRLDVDYLDNPKVLAAGRDGRDLHLASILWVARFLTDGHVPPEAVASIAVAAGLKARQSATAVDRALAAGLWLPNGHGFVVHDFVQMNGSRSDVEREREGWRLRQQRRRNKTGQFDGHGDVTP